MSEGLKLKVQGDPSKTEYRGGFLHAWMNGHFQTLDTVADIPTEFKIPIPLDERVERSTDSLARVHTFAFIAAIVILLAGFLWQRFS